MATVQFSTLPLSYKATGYICLKSHKPCHGLLLYTTVYLFDQDFFTVLCYHNWYLNFSVNPGSENPHFYRIL